MTNPDPPETRKSLLLAVRPQFVPFNLGVGRGSLSTQAFGTAPASSRRSSLDKRWAGSDQVGPVRRTRQGSRDHDDGLVALAAREVVRSHAHTMAKTSKKKATNVVGAVRPSHHYNSAAWLPPTGVFTATLSWQCDQLAALHETVSSAVVMESPAVKKEFEKARSAYEGGDEDASFAMDWFIDDLMSLDVQERWSALLQCVAVYHYLEGEVGSVFRHVMSGLPDNTKKKELRKVHKWDELAGLLLRWCDIDVTTLSDYARVNELRLVCNAVKHTGGLVSEELAKATSLVEGEPIKTTDLDLEAFRKAAIRFLKEMVTKTAAGLLKKHGKP